jgi:hypothetical protein
MLELCQSLFYLYIISCHPPGICPASSFLASWSYGSSIMCLQGERLKQDDHHNRCLKTTIRLPILRLLIREPLSRPVPSLACILAVNSIQIIANIRRELPKFMPNHIFRHRELMINLPIVNLKLQSDEIWQDGCRACLCLDWGSVLALFRLDDWETMFLVSGSR